MSEKKVKSIQILKEIPFFGEGDTLESRLRKVSLRGFPHVKIYEKAKFEEIFLTPEQIRTQLHTPQPNVYQNELTKVENLAELFQQKGIDITNLDRAYDYLAFLDSGEQTQWTILPPIVERMIIPRKNGRMNYEPLIGEELARHLQSQNLGINPNLNKLKHTSDSEIFDLINDGSHRIHFGFLNNGIKVVRISQITEGFPYYAAPQPYLSIKIMPEANEITTAMKVHIVESPGQKALYRLFPSGGIMSGEVRPPTKGEIFH